MGYRAVLTWARHFHPRDWAQWAGLLLVFSGIFRAVGWHIPVISTIIRPVIDAAAGTADPGVLILIGAGYLGLHWQLKGTNHK